MTTEQSLEQIAVSLERIAKAIEALVEQRKAPTSATPAQGKANQQ